jgi:hypothetical protein
MAEPTCALRRTYDPAALLAAHPPRLRHPHKRLVFELACPPGAVHRGPVELTRWQPAPLPAAADLRPLDLAAAPCYYDYRGAGDAVWHVNFADPQLFVAYGSRLLAQDELQAAEHPLLGSLREALIAEGLPALTEEANQPTPVLVRGVERRCAIDTAPHPGAGRADGLYGNRFAAASADDVRAAVTVLSPPTVSHLIAMAAPTGGPGPYWPREIAQVVTTATTAFAAAVVESRRAWPGVPVEIHTGFWGCGAFGGNRELMALLQLLSARLVGVDRLRFHTAESTHDLHAGAAQLERVLATGAPGEPLAAVLDRVAELDYAWGQSDGN